jgi:hypothetical protein
MSVDSPGIGTSPNSKKSHHSTLHMESDAEDQQDGEKAEHTLDHVEITAQGQDESDQKGSM